MHRRVAALAALVLAASAFSALAAKPEVVAVVACDPYGDVKKQLRWLGTLVDQPALDALAETPIMMATQFKGLAGLDVTRPIGVVVTADGDRPVAHAFLPVKDLDRLLGSLENVVGPAEEIEGGRRLSLPSGMVLDVVKKDGWAIAGPQGVAPPVEDPAALVDPVVKQFTLGVQAFPSRMPEGMRGQLREMLDQVAAAAAAQGQALDRDGLADMMESLEEVESLLLGVAIDAEGERVAVEMRNTMVAGSKAAATLGEMSKAAATVATAATADGKAPAMTMHLAMAVPAAMRQAAIDGLKSLAADDDAPPGADTAMSLVREALAAMIEAGGYDAAAAVDTSVVAADAAKPVPAVTLGMKVKDGAALEAKVKKLVAAAGELPDVGVKFDSGKAAGANLHTLTFKNAGFPGADAADDSLDVTLAVTPNYCFMLAGGDVPKRLAAVVGASGKPDPDVKPMADATVSLAPVLRFFAAISRARGEDDAAGMEAAADVADAQKSALVRMMARPIERGASLVLAADAGAIRTVAASVKTQAGPRGGRPLGVPATGGPDPIPFAIPVQ